VVAVPATVDGDASSAQVAEGGLAAVPRHLGARPGLRVVPGDPGGDGLCRDRLPLAGAIGFGEFAHGGGRQLIAAALAGVALAVVGETLRRRASGWRYRELVGRLLRRSR
jgi:hypothetical protein